MPLRRVTRLRAPEARRSDNPVLISAGPGVVRAKGTAQLEQAILAQCTADQGETRHSAQVSCYGHDKLAELAKCPMNTWTSHAIAELEKK